MPRIQNKIGRKSNYLKSLQNNENHSEARKKALLRDSFQCKLCLSKIRLEFHHISYHILGKELENDNIKWCVILCETCHQLVHNNLSHIWNPKNYNKKSL